jgi:hypothetical protein
MKALTVSPPDTFRVDEKFTPEYSVVNCCGVVITSNHRTDGIYLPVDDRRHYVAWSDCTKEDFSPEYFRKLWGWYENEGGFAKVAAYLSQLDNSSFDPKAPPPKTQAFWDIVAASKAPEDAELTDVLEEVVRWELGENDGPHAQVPDAVTLQMVTERAAEPSFKGWLEDRKNRRTIPHRFDSCGYTAFHNPDREDGLWTVKQKRQVIYVAKRLLPAQRLEAARQLASTGKCSRLTLR